MDEVRGLSHAIDGKGWCLDRATAGQYRGASGWKIRWLQVFESVFRAHIRLE